MAAIRARAAAGHRLALVAAAAGANLALALGLAREPKAMVAAVALVAILTLAVIRPGLVLCAALFLLVVAGEVFAFVPFPSLAFAGLQIGLSDLLLALALLAWLGWEARPLAARGEPALADAVAAVMHEPFAWALVPLLLIAAYDLARGGPGSLSSARLFAYSVVMLVAIRVLDTPRALRAFGLTIVAGAVAASLIAVALVLSGRSLNATDLSTGGARGLSIGGSFLVAAALLYVLARRVVSDAALRGVAPLLVLVLAGGVLASGARETWVGVAMAMVLFAVVSPVRGLWRLAAVVVCAALLAVGAYSLAPRQQHLGSSLASLENRIAAIHPASAVQDPSVQDRLTKWRVVWEQVRSHPVLGTGFGHAETYWTNFGGNNFERFTIDDPENTHLWLWARTGTLGFAAWVAFNVLAAGSLLWRFFHARSPLARATALWATATLLVIWSGMTFSPISAFGGTILLYWLAVAAAPITRRLDADARAG